MTMPKPPVPSKPTHPAHKSKLQPTKTEIAAIIKKMQWVEEDAEKAVALKPEIALDCFALGLHGHNLAIFNATQLLKEKNQPITTDAIEKLFKENPSLLVTIERSTPYKDEGFMYDQIVALVPLEDTSSNKADREKNFKQALVYFMKGLDSKERKLFERVYKAIKHFSGDKKIPKQMIIQQAKTMGHAITSTSNKS